MPIGRRAETIGLRLMHCSPGSMNMLSGMRSITNEHLHLPHRRLVRRPLRPNQNRTNAKYASLHEHRRMAARGEQRRSLHLYRGFTIMLDKTELSPTDEQQDIINLIETTNDNLLVNALAGTGKTTTLDMVQSASPQQPVLCLAFNKRIADEMSKRFPSTTTVRTFNSLGHRIWASAVGKISLDPKKTQAHLKEGIASLKGDDRRAASDAWFDIVSAISLAKALGYVPDGKFPSAKRLLDRSQFHASLEEKPSPLIADLIDSLLFSSIQASYKGLIDYNYQIFMPSLFGGTFP